MNKKFNDFFAQRGYEIVGNNAYGSLRGYEVTFHIEMMNNVAPLQAHFNLFATRDEKVAIYNALREKKIKYLKYDVDQYGITIGLNDITVNAMLKKLDDILNQIVDIFANSNALGKGYCPLCGQLIELEDSKTVNVDWARVTMHAACVADINAVIEEANKDFTEAPNNYLKGFLGILIGALVGVAMFFILYLIGFVTALTAVVAIILGITLYKKFGGKPNKVMIIMAFVTTLVTQLFAVFGLYVYVAGVLAYSEALPLAGLEAFAHYFEVFPEFKSEFLTNFFLTFVFTALGLVAQIQYAKKMVHRTKKLN